jgi:putative oxidoreductase
MSNKMGKAKDVLLMRFLPERTQIALTILRVWTGVELFMQHGWEKRPERWGWYMVHFIQNPIGIGTHASFFIAFTSDFICSILLILGLATRWAALFALGNILVAWALIAHFLFLNHDDHGELMLLYVGCLLVLVIAGPGKLSLDRFLARGRRETPYQQETSEEPA